MPPFAENFLKINSKPWKSITPQKFGILWVKIKTNESHSNQFLQIIQYLQTVLCFQISAFKFHPLAHCPKNNLTLSIHSWSRCNGRCGWFLCQNYVCLLVHASCHLLQLWQIPFSCQYSDYFWDSCVPLWLAECLQYCTVYSVHCTKYEASGSFFTTSGSESWFS